MTIDKMVLGALILGSLQATAGLAHAYGRTAEEIYGSLNGELLVQFLSDGHPAVGTAVAQKNNPSGNPAFCRRSGPVVPYPVYHYECFYRSVTGTEAERLYSESESLEQTVVFRSAENGGALLGVSWEEKFIGGQDATICVKTAPVAPHAVAHYSCYRDRGGVGGAVSGGN